MPLRLSAAIAACLLLLPRSNAHDLWLVPPEAVAVGKAVRIHAVSGSKFLKGDKAPDPAKFAKRTLVLPDGSIGTLEADGTEDTVGLLKFAPKEEGVHLAAVETTAKIIALEADKFNEYLVSDGLPHIFLLRSTENTLNQAAKERYSKSPKTIFRVGDGVKGDATKPMGLPLEIVPLKDPFAVKPGGALPVQLFFTGKPLAGANLGWDHPGEGDLPAGSVRTDEKGRALIPVAKSGLITIRITHMTRPRAADYEWESFWSTLTFRIAE